MKKTGHNIWLWITIIAVSMIFFLFVGEHNQVMQKDSQVYISWIYTRGVMPIYPLFIEMLKLLFGEVNYLYAAVVIQGIISVVCSIDFCLFIKKQFKLHDIEFFIIFLLSLLVYTIEAPEVINNHFILTESLTYPLFYIYMKYLLRGLLNASRKDMYINWIWALILSLIRSQLQLLWAVSAVVFAWLHLKRYWTKHTSHKCSMVLWHLGIAAILMGVITLGGYKFVSTSVSVYRQYFLAMKGQLIIRAYMHSGTELVIRWIEKMLIYLKMSRQKRYF